MGSVMGVKNFSKLPPEFYSSPIGNLISRKLPPHYPQTTEADKTHKWYNYWLPYIESGNDLKSAKYQLLPKCWTKNLSSTGRMMPKFIVTIGDLLPPTIVLFSHSRTMPDYLRVVAPSLFRHRQKYSDVLMYAAVRYWVMWLSAQVSKLLWNPVSWDDVVFCHDAEGTGE